MNNNLEIINFYFFVITYVFGNNSKHELRWYVFDYLNSFNNFN